VVLKAGVEVSLTNSVKHLSVQIELRNRGCELMEAKFRDAMNVVSEDEIVDLESRMVAIPSYTTEEGELAEFIADFLNDNRVQVGLQHVPFPNNAKGFSPKSYNVVGRIHGTADAPSLMFNGHMDHGPLDGRNSDDLSGWARPPFRPTIEDGYLYGKGCQDEKGGICAMLIAAVTMRRLNLRPRGDLRSWTGRSGCGLLIHRVPLKILPLGSWRLNSTKIDRKGSRPLNTQP
jgi:hypothetical protein